MKKSYNFFSKLIIYLVIVIISLNFVPTGDDYYFLNTGFESLANSVFFNSNNGRYLGNFCGIFISNLSKFNTLQYAKCLIMGTGIFLIIFLCSKLSSINETCVMLLSTLFILIAPSSMYREVYSWTPGYMNYLMPVLLILLILNILKKYIHTDKDISTKDIFFMMILGISCQLFMEHITIYMVLMSLILVIISSIKKLRMKKVIIPLFLSNLVGAIIMFSAKGYRSINNGDQYRDVGISNIGDLLERVIFNLFEMSKDIVTDNTFLSIAILSICAFIINKANLKKGYMNKIILGLSLVCSIYIIGISFIDILKFSRIIRLTKYALDIVITFIFAMILFYTIYKVDFNNKKQMWFYYFSIVLSAAPLIIVSPIGTRCFFISYVFLILIAMDMFEYMYENNLINTNYIKYITISLLIIIIVQKLYIYHNIHSVYEERLEYIQSEMQDRIETITIPYLPFNKYVQNDTSHFLGQYYYYEKPNDIEFKMIDYDEWINEIN